MLAGGDAWGRLAPEGARLELGHPAGGTSCSPWRGTHAAAVHGHGWTSPEAHKQVLTCEPCAGRGPQAYRHAHAVVSLPAVLKHYPSCVDLVAVQVGGGHVHVTGVRESGEGDYYGRGRNARHRQCARGCHK